MKMKVTTVDLGHGEKIHHATPLEPDEVLRVPVTEVPKREVDEKRKCPFENPALGIPFDPRGRRL